MGSHGKIGRFNAVFAAGNATTITLRKSGDMVRPISFQNSLVGEAHKLAWRGYAGWRYDNFPAKMIMRFWFSPAADGFSNRWINNLTIPAY
jgi:hypothetical protein